MAAETLASISDALSQTFAPQLEKQWNRTATTAARIPARPGGGKNAAWDVEFSGSTATTVAEGSDVADGELDADVDVPATLAWAHYRGSFKVTETQLDAAASSVGIPQALEDIFGERIMSKGAAITSLINQHILTGTGSDGTDATIFGLLGAALDTTGTYANISRSTYTEWCSSVLANGGTARALTVDLLAQLDQNIFNAAGDVWDFGVCDPATYRKYESLFLPVQRQAIDGRGPLVQGFGAAELFYKGRPIYRDKDMTAGTMILGTSSTVEVKYLPRLQTPRDSVDQRMVNGESSNGDKIRTATGIPIRIAILAKTGDSIKVSMKTSIQMLVKRPNAWGVIKDIATT